MHEEINPNFEIIWTSFGLGQAESFDPSLAASLVRLTTAVSFVKGKAAFDVIATPQRHDLALLKHLLRNGVKEFYVQNFDQEGNPLTTRLKFTAFELLDYCVWSNKESETFNPTTGFTLSGVLEVVN